MRIAMMGAGALGSYFGGRLAAAGEDVVLVGRGAHLQAMREGGLSIESPLGDARIETIAVSDDPSAVGPVDAVLFLVKRYDTAAAAEAMAPLLAPGTVVVTFQNGIGADADIRAAAPAANAFPGVAVIPANVPRPGVVRHEADVCSLVFGAPDGDHPPALTALAERLAAAPGMEAAVVGDIVPRLFDKFAFLSTLAAMTALTRLPLGAILADERARDLYFRALAESVDVSRAACPDLPEDLLERETERVRRLPPAVRASMADDLARGRRLELDYLSGTVVGLGETHGIATPVHRTAHGALHPFRDGAPAT